MEEGEIVGQHSVRYLGYIDFMGKWGLLDFGLGQLITYPETSLSPP